MMYGSGLLGQGGAVGAPLVNTFSAASLTNMYQRLVVGARSSGGRRAFGSYAKSFRSFKGMRV
jgi:hypothetical protein